MANWRFIMFDVRTREPQAELSVVDNVQFSYVLNAPGSFSATLPLIQPAGSPVDTAMLKPPRAIFAVEKDGVILWAGPVWTHNYDLKNGTVTIAGEGYQSYLRKRLVRATRTYTGIEQVNIAWDLINYTQTTTTASNLGILNATTATGVTRDRTYFSYERKVVGEVIEQLAAVDGGFNFKFVPYWDSNDRISVDFVTQYPANGRATTTRFDLGINADIESIKIDGTSLAYQVDAIGQGTGTATPLAGVVDSARRSANVALEVAVVHSDVLLLPTLLTHATFRLNRGREPVAITSLVLPLDSINDIALVDRVTISADYGLLQMPASTYVITQMDADVGADTLTLHTAPVEIFDND